MRKAMLVLAVLFIVGSIGTVIAQCGGGGCQGCPNNCPGQGQTMKSVTGQITWICPKHHAVKVKSGDSELLLLVNSKCKNKDTLQTAIGKLKVGDSLTCSYYKVSDKLYLCQIGGSTCPSQP